MQKHWFSMGKNCETSWPRARGGLFRIVVVTSILEALATTTIRTRTQFQSRITTHLQITQQLCATAYVACWHRKVALFFNSACMHNVKAHCCCCCCCCCCCKTRAPCLVTEVRKLQAPRKAPQFGAPSEVCALFIIQPTRPMLMRKKFNDSWQARLSRALNVCRNCMQDPSAENSAEDSPRSIAMHRKHSATIP